VGGIVIAILNVGPTGQLLVQAGNTVFGALGETLFGAIVYITITLFYYDLRIRKEAFDLQQRADYAGLSAEASQPTPPAWPMYPGQPGYQDQAPYPGSGAVSGSGRAAPRLRRSFRRRRSHRISGEGCSRGGVIGLVVVLAAMITAAGLGPPILLRRCGADGSNDTPLGDAASV